MWTDHVRQGDLLHAAPLRLDDHDVVHADRVAEGELHPGEHVGERRLRGEAGDDRHEPRGGEDARARGPGTREGQQDRADRDDHDRHHREPPDDEHLRAHPARDPVVGHVHAVAAEPEVLEEDREGAHQPGGGDDRDHVQQVVEAVAHLARRDRGTERDPDGDHHEQHAEGAAGAGDEPRRPLPPAGDDADDEGDDGGDEQGGGHGGEQRDGHGDGGHGEQGGQVHGSSRGVGRTALSRASSLAGAPRSTGRASRGGRGRDAGAPTAGTPACRGSARACRPR